MLKNVYGQLKLRFKPRECYGGAATVQLAILEDQNKNVCRARGVGVKSWAILGH